METSPSITRIADALRKFQATVDPVPKTATNPFFKSKYATLESIIEHIKAPMRDEGLSFSQLPDEDGLTTIIMHESGEWIKATAKINMGTKPQEQGSAITYMRRYALSAALGLATEDDDDGNEASKPAQKAATAPKTVAAPRKTTAPVDTDKAHIRTLLTELDEESTPANILFVTGLEAKPENFPAIIERLEALKEERSQE